MMTPAKQEAAMDSLLRIAAISKPFPRWTPKEQQMTLRVPRVGDGVYFFESRVVEPKAAVIVRTLGDHAVDLNVFTTCGLLVRTGVIYMALVEDGSPTSWWEWKDPAVPDSYTIDKPYRIKEEQQAMYDTPRVKAIREATQQVIDATTKLREALNIPETNVEMHSGMVRFDATGPLEDCLRKLQFGRGVRDIALLERWAQAVETHQIDMSVVVPPSAEAGTLCICREQPPHAIGSAECKWSADLSEIVKSEERSIVIHHDKKEVLYRLSWECVVPFGKGAQYFMGGGFAAQKFNPTPLASIPEECWHPTERVAPFSELVDQRDQLVKWAISEEQPIRNVKCELACGAGDNQSHTGPWSGEPSMS